jgi:hypothetical protein
MHQQLHHTLHRYSQSIRRSLVAGSATVLALGLHVSPVHAMTMRVTAATSWPIIELSGVIENGDTAKLERSMQALRNWPVKADHRVVQMMVLIDSRGGDVAEALKLGRYLRAHDASVETTNVCASSCVFVLASGIVRGGAGRVVIHRPFSTEIARLPMLGMLRVLQGQISAYVDEMNVPRRLVDLIFSVAPEDAYELGETEIGEFRIKQMDMDYAEELATYNARVSGLSRAEYMSRLKKFRTNLDRCFGGRLPTAQIPACISTVKQKLGLKGDYDQL